MIMLNSKFGSFCLHYRHHPSNNTFESSSVDYVSYTSYSTQTTRDNSPAHRLDEYICI